MRLQRDDRHRHGGQPLSRVLVIDIDTKPGKPNGWESIFDLMKEYEPLPETTSVITPSGGMHLYYAMPEGEPPCGAGWGGCRASTSRGWCRYRRRRS